MDTETKDSVWTIDLADRTLDLRMDQDPNVDLNRISDQLRNVKGIFESESELYNRYKIWKAKVSKRMWIQKRKAVFEP